MRTLRLHGRRNVPVKVSNPTTWEICILAGGLSRRMGRDKSRLKLGSRTLLNHIRAEAKSLGWPVRVIRRDAIPRCGPLGGIFTALQATRADAVLFLACDMPWVSASLLRAVLRRFGRITPALFVRSRCVMGFPCALRYGTLGVVADQIAQSQFSLQALARALNAKSLRPPLRWRAQLRNLNTPEEWRRAQRQWPRVRTFSPRKNR